MSDSKVYARFVTIISDHLDKKEVAIEFIGHHGRATRESIYRITKEKQKLTK